jgi:phosphate transport system protein
MSEEALRLTRLAIDSYAEGDEGLAAALDDIDDQLDELHADYIQAIFQSHSGGNLELEAAVQLALFGRYYERIGDHAVNMGERIVYMVTGWLPEHTGMARSRLRGEKPE